MATPAPAATTASAPAATPTTVPSVAQISTGTASAAAGIGIVGWIGFAIFLILFHLGAAKLSYDLHQSALWGFLSFLFASVYYPYYAFVYSARQEVSTSLFGGRRRKH